MIGTKFEMVKSFPNRELEEAYLYPMAEVP